MDMQPDLSVKHTLTGELCLGFAIVMIVAILIVPLPTFMLDLLIVANLTISVICLLASLYIRNPLRLAALPSFLLITTLIRLSINVSSTRLILLQADAGAVIDAFGDFVVQSNAIVGAVIFLILTMVQFLVIARGSERVAEVAARFSLDAMPGQQMAIDADLRAGAMTFKDARQRRRDLQSESRLFGAMDGAMKFIKGDAIAGVLITIVNIIGGLTIGVFQDGLPFEQAARTYTLLTIGDGLTSQIPALLIATSAALVVTRLSANAPPLGDNLRLVLARHQHILWLVSALFAILAAIPGLPALPFALSAVTTAALAIESRRARHLLFSTHDSEADAPVMLIIQICPSLFNSTATVDTLNHRLAISRSELRRRLGFSIPAPVIVLTPRLPALTFTLLIDEIPTLTQTLTPEDDPVDLIDVMFNTAIVRHAATLLTIQDVQDLLDQLREQEPALVLAAVPAAISLPELTRVLQRLLSSSIPIRHLRLILTALAELGDADLSSRVGTARSALRRQIAHLFSPPDGVPFKVWLLHQDLAGALHEHVRSPHNPKFPPHLKTSLVDALAKAHDEDNSKLLKPETMYIVTRADIRAALEDVLAGEDLDLVVLAFEELSPLTTLEPLGEISTNHLMRQGA